MISKADRNEMLEMMRRNQSESAEHIGKDNVVTDINRGINNITQTMTSAPETPKEKNSGKSMDRCSDRGGRRPQKNVEESRQIGVRIPESMFLQLNAAIRFHDNSLTQYIRDVIGADLEKNADLYNSNNIKRY